MAAIADSTDTPFGALFGQRRGRRPQDSFGPCADAVLATIKRAGSIGPHHVLPFLPARATPAQILRDSPHGLTLHAEDRRVAELARRTGRAAALLEADDAVFAALLGLPVALTRDMHLLCSRAVCAAALSDILHPSERQRLWAPFARATGMQAPWRQERPLSQTPLGELAPNGPSLFGAILGAHAPATVGELHVKLPALLADLNIERVEAHICIDELETFTGRPLGARTLLPAPGEHDEGAMLDTLGLSTRTRNTLRRVGIHSLGQLERLGQGQLALVPGLGPKGRTEIARRFRAHTGRRLRQNTPAADVLGGAPLGDWERTHRP